MEKFARYLVILLFAVAGAASRADSGSAQLAPASAPAQDSPAAYTVERLALPGPVAGVVVRVNLADPRVRVRIALADDRDPDGPGPGVGLLDTPSSIARRNDFDVTINASFFAALTVKQTAGKPVRYFVGNGAYPIGWHRSEKIVVRPGKETFRSALLVRRDGAVGIVRTVTELPDDCAFAVSGNVMMLEGGRITPPKNDAAREPRSAVGIGADGRTLFVVAIDGRQEGYSRGVTMAELGQILLDLGARDGLNLDGGGSTALVLKDPATGGYVVVNRPSDHAGLSVPVAVERPVVDVLGIRIVADAQAKVN
jgi:hypothetical protein